MMKADPRGGNFHRSTILCFVVIIIIILKIRENKSKQTKDLKMNLKFFFFLKLIETHLYKKKSNLIKTFLFEFSLKTIRNIFIFFKIYSTGRH